MVVERPRTDKQQRVLPYITPILAGITVLVPLVVLVQWLSGFIESVGPSLEWVPMAPFTAILFLLIAVSLLLQRQVRYSRVSSGLTRSVSVFVLLVSSYLLLRSFISALPIDIEGFLTAQTTSASGLIIGRMSPITAILFILVSISLFDSTIPRGKTPWLIIPANILSLGVFMASIVILSGYWYGAPLFYGGTITPVALLTAVSFLFVSSAQLFNKPENFFYNLVTSPSVYAHIMRAIIPVLVFVLLIAGYIEEIVRRDINPDLHAVISVIATFAVLATVTLLIAIVSKRVEHDIAQKGIALMVSETRYRRLFEAAKDGVLIVDAETGLIVDVNPFLTDLLGFSQEDLIGKELWEIGIFKDIVANKANFEELRQKGYMRYEDLPLKTAGGQQRDVEFVSNVYEVDHLKVIQCNIRDITARKKAEDALEQSEKRYSTLVEKGSDGVIVLQDGLVKFANSKAIEITGLSQGEVLGKPFTDFVTPGYRDLMAERYKKRVDGENVPDQYEGEILKKDGSGTPIEVNASIIEYDGRPAVLGMVRDITERKRVEDQLKTTEQNFRNSLDDSPFGIRIITKDGDLLYANKAMLDVYGYASIEELRTIPAGKNYTPASYAEHQQRRELRKHDKPVPANYEISIVRKDGEIRHLSVSRKEVVWNNGRQFQAVYQDITERKRAEEQLTISEQNFRNSLDDSPLGIRIDSADAELLYANKSLLDIHGYSSFEELKGTPAKERMTPESYAEHLDRREQRAQGKPVPPDYELDIVRKDGEIRHLSVSRKEVEWNGKTQLQIIFQDITERKRAEEMLELSTKEWESTFDSITDLISIHSADHRILRVNKAFADSLDKTKDEIIGKYCYELVHGTDKPPSYCPHDKTLIEKIPVVVEEYEPHLDMWLQISTSPVFNEQGEVVATVHSTKDISASKKMQEKLMAQDRLASIGQLVSGVAHEINNPLTSIVGFSELLLQRDLSVDVKTDLQIINDEAKRSALIVTNLLTFARKQKEGKELIDINEPIWRVLALRSHEQLVNNIQVNVALAPDLPQITGNSSQFQQVFLNLIVNAEQAMLEANDKGTLTVTTGRAGDNVRISIADDGPGISSENMNRLFTPFFTTKGVGKGTGLGLSISHGIITEHGGRIFAESEPGKGAVFIIELPIPQQANR